MPQVINEPDVDFEAQIQEIKRLVSTTRDADRRAALEEKLRELELARIQGEQELALETSVPDKGGRRKSFRPISARPRTTTLTPLTEDVEVNSTSTAFHGLDAYRLDDGGLPLVAEVFSSSYDESFDPSNVLVNDSHRPWISSGLYPQFLRLFLREPKRLAAVEITCRHVKKLRLRVGRSRSVAHDDMMLVGQLEVSTTDSSKLDTHRFVLSATSRSRQGGESKTNEDEEEDEDAEEEAQAADKLEVLQIDIESGFRDFVCVYFVRLRLVNAEEPADIT